MYKNNRKQGASSMTMRWAPWIHLLEETITNNLIKYTHTKKTITWTFLKLSRGHTVNKEVFTQENILKFGKNNKGAVSKQRLMPSFLLFNPTIRKLHSMLVKQKSELPLPQASCKRVIFLRWSGCHHVITQVSEAEFWESVTEKWGILLPSFFYSLVESTPCLWCH